MLANYWSVLYEKDIRIIVIYGEAKLLHDTAGLENVGDENTIRLYILLFN